MIVPNQAVRIVIAAKPADFRKGHDGLAALAERELGLDPHSGVIIVFRAKRGNRIKVLLWDGSGMVMSYKRLEHTSLAGTMPAEYANRSIEDQNLTELT